MKTFTWKPVRKHMRVLRELIALRFHRLMIFRLDFFSPFFIDGSLFLIQLLAFAAVYANVDTIGGWGQGEMILYIGSFSLLNAVNMTVYFFGINSIPYKIRSGELDLYLSKPVSPLFRLTFEGVSPGSLPLIFMSICILYYGVRLLDKKPEGLQVAGYLFWIFIMAILYYELEVIIRSISLYIVSMARIGQLEEACIDLCMRLPGIAFRSIYKVLFYLILPYGLLATLPVQSITREMHLQTGIYGVFVVLLFSAITGIIWKQGLKHYNSTGS